MPLPLIQGRYQTQTIKLFPTELAHHAARALVVVGASIAGVLLAVVVLSQTPHKRPRVRSFILALRIPVGVPRGHLVHPPKLDDNSRVGYLISFNFVGFGEYLAAGSR